MCDAIVLTGPTAVGKTELSLGLARALNAEIISLDSRLVYRGMDIGTAKPTAQEQARTPHHLIDVTDPGARFTVSDYIRQAADMCADITARGRTPLFVGGTLMYLNAMIKGFAFGELDQDPDVRNELEQRAAKTGAPALHQELEKVDPVSAGRIHPNDARRIVRALEIYRVTGQTMTERNRDAKRENPFRNITIFGLCRDRDFLNKIINERTMIIYNKGLIEETRRVLEQWPAAEPFLTEVIGYADALRVIEGEYSREQAIEATQKATRAFAKRQFTWFRRMRGVTWLNLDLMDTDAGMAFVRSALHNNEHYY